ncbi:unnamed protein product [Discosporangium mesarthrocarpum]
MKMSVVDDEALYIRSFAPSAVPPDGFDELEFLLKPSDGLVFFRSRSRKVVKAGPVVVGDGGSNKIRMEKIRRRVGWPEKGFDDYFQENGYTTMKKGYLNEFNLMGGAKSSYGEDEDDE